MRDTLVDSILALNAAGLTAYQEACRVGDAVLAQKLLDLGRETSRCLSMALKRRVA